MRLDPGQDLGVEARFEGAVARLRHPRFDQRLERPAGRLGATSGGVLLAAAVRLGGTRLIDNLWIPPKDAAT